MTMFFDKPFSKPRSKRAAAASIDACLTRNNIDGGDSRWPNIETQQLSLIHLTVMSQHAKPTKRSTGVDTLLTAHGKRLKTGEEIRFTLVKGPSHGPIPDPVNVKAPHQQFPLIAKFPVSVVKPDLNKAPWNTARLFQQDAPKAEEDSDDESNEVKKRWRPRQDIPKRQWVLQEQVEFLEHMMLKAQHKTLPKDQVSTRYHGIPEHNPSQFILLETTTNANDSTIKVTTLPTPNATISFSQPKVMKTLSMTEAEQAIQDQRGKMTRFMMHDKQRMLNANQSPQNQSRKRLFGKLNKLKNDDEDDDDIMGDLAFRNRKGSGRARKELLDTLGDSGIKVDADGVLGGSDDVEFGRGTRFGNFKAGVQNDAANTKKGGTDESAKGNDGLAMADDFYQRDVQAEYDELDYDANEQFDDDDVDVGETEMVVDGGGFADEDEEDDFDEDGVDLEKITGAEGLASASGFRLMLAKIRGEITPEQIAESEEKKKKEEAEKLQRAADAEKKQKEQQSDSMDNLTKIIADHQRVRAEKEKEEQEQEETAAAAPIPTLASGDLTNQVDENGQRIININSVRREIWLHHGTIKYKRLMKIFDVSKKSSEERRATFQQMVKELCTLETDPSGGRMLVLKQHYSNMG